MLMLVHSTFVPLLNDIVEAIHHKFPNLRVPQVNNFDCATILLLDSIHYLPV
jgi:hypothetical protein